MTHTKATILVDIDGVLNAWEARQPLPSHLHQARASRWIVTLDHRHPGWFRELEQVADLQWASMWQKQAASHFGAVADIGQDWDFLHFDAFWANLPLHVIKQTRTRTGLGVGSYKMPLIEFLAEDGRPLVWLDDDMADAHLAWADRRHAAGLPTLFIRPNPAEGFTRRQFEQVKAFAAEYSRGEVLAA